MVRQILWTLIIHDIPSFFMNWWIHNFVESYLIFFTFHTFFFQWECFTTNWTLIGCLSIMNSSLSKTRSTDVERMLLLSIMNCCNMFFQACGVIKTSITSCTWVGLLSFLKFTKGWFSILMYQSFTIGSYRKSKYKTETEVQCNYKWRWQKFVKWTQVKLVSDWK